MTTNGAFGTYIQGNHPTYVENLVVGSAAIDGQGAIDSFAYTGTATNVLNIGAWQFNAYVVRIGKYAMYTVDSPGNVPLGPGLTMLFSIPYSPNARPPNGNTNDTTAFGIGQLTDSNGLTYSFNMTSTANGAQRISGALTFPDNPPATCSVRCMFTVNLN